MPGNTKDTIAEAARKLVKEKQIKKLTVKDIVEECQIRDCFNSCRNISAAFD